MIWLRVSIRFLLAVVSVLVLRLLMMLLLFDVISTIKYASCLRSTLVVCFMPLLVDRCVCYLRIYSHQIHVDVQKYLRQHEESVSQIILKHEQRVDNMRIDMNVFEEQINRRMTQVLHGQPVSLHLCERKRSLFESRIAFDVDVNLLFVSTKTILFSE